MSHEIVNGVVAAVADQPAEWASWPDAAVIGSLLWMALTDLALASNSLTLMMLACGRDRYYGIAGNFRYLLGLYRFVERYWRKMLNKRDCGGQGNLGSIQ